MGTAAWKAVAAAKRARISERRNMVAMMMAWPRFGFYDDTTRTFVERFLRVMVRDGVFLPSDLQLSTHKLAAFVTNKQTGTTPAGPRCEPRVQTNTVWLASREQRHKTDTPGGGLLKQFRYPGLANLWSIVTRKKNPRKTCIFRYGI